MKFVVDTNVPIVANGREGNYSIDCRLSSIKFLQKLLTGGKIVLDLGGEIQNQYRKHLSPKGQPGVGDQFFRAVLNSEPRRVLRIELDRRSASEEYADFPDDPALETFDPSDRVFAAAARKSGAPVANSVDGDWLDYRSILESHGITIEFVCGGDPSAWWAKRE